MAESAFCVGMTPSKTATLPLTHVAASARRGFFREIGEQRLAAAARRLAQHGQRGEAVVLDAAALFAHVLFVDAPAEEGHVVKRVERQRIGRQPVAARAPDLLIVALNGRRHIGMGDEAHVRLVDAHPEGDGRDGDDGVFTQETVAIAIARRLIHPRMIGQRVVTLLLKVIRKVFGALARRAIDDAAFALVFFEKVRELAFRLVL